jgi:hypothetical protein
MEDMEGTVGMVLRHQATPYRNIRGRAIPNTCVRVKRSSTAIVNVLIGQYNDVNTDVSLVVRSACNNNTDNLVMALTISHACNRRLSQAHQAVLLEYGNPRLRLEMAV